MVRQRLLLHNVVKNICRFLAVRMFFAICISIILTPVISIRARTRIELNRLHGYKSVFAVAGLGAVIALSLAITLLTPVTANAAADDTVNFQARLESNTATTTLNSSFMMRRAVEQLNGLKTTPTTVVHPVPMSVSK
jgi:branched-subunit amino acid transport protein